MNKLIQCTLIKRLSPFIQKEELLSFCKRKAINFAPHEKCFSTVENCSHRVINYRMWSPKKRFGVNKSLLFKPMRDLEILPQGCKTEAGHQKENFKKIALWKRVALVSAVGAAVAYAYYSAEREKELKKEEVRYEEFKKIGFGGDWTLIDHDGKERSSTDFRGHWVLMYFGFTHCPDICPEELEKLVEVVKHFDEAPNMPSMQPIFVTLDPERDTPPVIKGYLAEYKCPRLVGFTGSMDTIKKVAKQYRAYFGKGPTNEDNDYIVDHTIITYVINPRGEFVNYFDRSVPADCIINTVTDHIGKYNRLEERRK